MSQGLPDCLDGLLFRGQLTAAHDHDVTDFLWEIAVCCERGEITTAQADALCAMLGFAHATGGDN